MSEIQSAEEFANMIYLFKNIIVRDDKGLISDIRARDKAIVEEYINLYLSASTDKNKAGLGLGMKLVASKFLRELGGEQ